MATESKRKRSRTLRVVWEEAPDTHARAHLLQALRMLLVQDRPEEAPDESARQLSFWD